MGAIAVVQGFASIEGNVPEATTRQRTVWTTDEKRLLNRISKIFNEHGDKLLLRCGNPLCPDDRIFLHAAPSEPTGAILRCGCTSRVFSPSC